ncbi:metalloprotease TldD [Kordiimonas sp. SCSIO 12610]|uniref:metalloprotease TldD n=1 Tax=Kordiimonas sp. SCSIO 12610 TaxID=2829597 RepID=UPI00210EF0DF|nr:metalloprotease TldD [Kordiimonas sp. SCSIO 12610]UTW54913.1 metalloprotease TldD [Kordiimonas sp. SCSIO 12610]
MPSDDSPSLDFFFSNTDLDANRTQSILDETLHGMDDGELYLETTQSESFTFDDGRLKAATFDTTQGFGLRAVAEESSGYAHSNELTEDAIKRASSTVGIVKAGKEGTMSAAPARSNKQLYSDQNPLGGIEFAEKVALLEKIDAYTRAKDARVKQVSASLLGSWQAVEIMRAGGHRVRDIRPLVRLNVSVVMENGDRQESGFDGAGGRRSYDNLFDPQNWQAQADEAIRQAEVNLESVDTPAGEMTVVLGPGWPGVLLHEAVGHGLEGDFNRKKTSAFAGLLGERVAAPGVTVLDDGTIEARRGSLSVDDEGTPTERTVLIEDGILKGYMQDRLNARLMGMQPTGNGRRQSFAHSPMPRMTNTFMLAGDKDPAEIIASVDDGLYAVNFGGGQVDITSGKFVFSCTEAYRIRGGKIAEPVKGATLIGNGPDVLTRVSMIGNDLKLDNGVGICGKAGQTVPAGVGQPTLRIDGLTVGGTSF